MATPTPYDQASRHLVKLNPHLTLAWLMQESPDNFRFEGWIDPSIPERLGYPDKMSDTVAILERLDVVEPTWLADAEYQSSPDSDMLFRVRDYTNNLQWKCRPPNANRGDQYNVGAIVINLTGVQELPPATQWGRAGFLSRTEYRIVNLKTLNADTVMQGILSGEIPENILGFIPLMQNGNTPAIIEQWKSRALLIEPRSARADMAFCVKTFAELVETRPIWEQALEGWNVVESQFWKELAAETVANVKAVAESEKQAELLKQNQEFLLELLVERFGHSPFHENLVYQIDDPARLARLRKILLTATSWDAVTSIE